MNDRELLELAARAAGYVVKGELVDADDKFLSLTVNKGPGTRRFRFNSLTDPADALRLAVALGFEVASHPKAKPRPYTVVYFNIGVYDHTAMEQHASDPLAATMRAITCAAAEIGRVKT